MYVCVFVTRLIHCLTCTRFSAVAREIFREVAGFVHFISELGSMENSFDLLGESEHIQQLRFTVLEVRGFIVGQ